MILILALREVFGFKRVITFSHTPGKNNRGGIPFPFNKISGNED
ncbi:MAG: hypothetical protein ABIN89_13370 [Chitinophagaceae bacterium]